MKGNKKKPPVRKQQSFPVSGVSVLLLLGILVLTVILYSRSIGNGFVTWDDPEYVIVNPIIKDFSLHGIKQMFTSFYEGNYHPLTALSNAIEFHFFKLNPKPYHIINLIIHLLNIVLVFLVVAKLSNRSEAAVIVSLFFAIHPLHVESVAWIAERKDVLYSFFFLAAWLAYITYLKESQKLRLLLYSTILFSCSLLSKSMAVTFPVVLILTDYFLAPPPPKGGIKENLFMRSRFLYPPLGGWGAKIPFFILALVVGGVALHSQSSSGSTEMAPHFPFFQRIFLSSYGLLYYIFKLFIPIHLSVFHPYPVKSGALPFEYYIAPVVLAGLMFGAWRLALKFKVQSSKFFIFGILFFLVTVAPVIQLLPVGKALTAERYSYIPYIGLLFIVASFLFPSEKVELQSTKPLQTPAFKFSFWKIAGVLVFVVLFSVITYQRLSKWKDGITLFTDIIEKYPNSSGIDFAWYNRGLTKNNMGDYKGAIEDYTEAIRINPEYVQAWYNRGFSKGMSQDFKSAVTDFDSAIHLYPKHYMAYNNRGNAKGMLSDYQNALTDFSEAIRIKPDYAEAYFNRGFTRLKMGMNKEACADWRTSIGMGYNKAEEMIQKFCL